jgi:hypothetical protein
MVPISGLLRINSFTVLAVFAICSTIAYFRDARQSYLTDFPHPNTRNPALFNAFSQAALFSFLARRKDVFRAPISRYSCSTSPSDNRWRCLLAVLRFTPRIYTISTSGREIFSALFDLHRAGIDPRHRFGIDLHQFCRGTQPPPEETAPLQSHHIRGTLHVLSSRRNRRRTAFTYTNTLPLFHISGCNKTFRFALAYRSYGNGIDR